MVIQPTPGSAFLITRSHSNLSSVMPRTVRGIELPKAKQLAGCSTPLRQHPERSLSPQQRLAVCGLFPVGAVVGDYDVHRVETQSLQVGAMLLDALEVLRGRSVGAHELDLVQHVLTQLS